jgi:anti-sigma regulatory factor (Ser/Thr protein kinase)
MDLIPRKPIELHFCSSPAHLPVIRAAVERMCDLLGMDSEAAGGVVLSVDEAMTNIIKHAYKGDASQPIDVVMTPIGEPDPRALEICLSDRGRYVDPSEIRSRDLDEVRPGGLGVHIIVECMDEVTYSPRDGGGTVLTMVKNLQSTDAEASKKVSS